MKTKAQINATRKYDEATYDRISVLIKKGKKEVYRKIATDEGMSLNAWILQAMQEKAGI